jgi:hypothetical protein
MPLTPVIAANVCFSQNCSFYVHATTQAAQPEKRGFCFVLRASKKPQSNATNHKLD